MVEIYEVEKYKQKLERALVLLQPVYACVKPKYLAMRRYLFKNWGSATLKVI